MSRSEQSRQALNKPDRGTETLGVLLAQAAAEAGDEATAARALQGALVRAALQPRPSPALRPAWTVAVAALALVAGFALRGWVLPAQRLITPPPRVVRVEVPVVRERVVERTVQKVVRVPVVRVRRVYVTRQPAPQPPAPQPAAVPAAPVLSFGGVDPSTLPPPPSFTHVESVRLAHLEREQPQ